jgi:hypothetical protein
VLVTIAASIGIVLCFPFLITQFASLGELGALC